MQDHNERKMMTGKNQYSEANNTSRKDYSEFVTKLSDKDLATPMPANWSVSGVMAHLAFWDFRAITLIKKWQAGGVNDSPNDIDVVNEATRPLFVALEPHKALQLSLEYAVELDALVDSLDADFIRAVEERGKAVRLDRAHHRYMHMNDIKAVLGLK
jgi:Mycothiol maleylpyruvate isomerase N-terminal domain